MIYIGIDPGKTGAICILNEDLEVSYVGIKDLGLLSFHQHKVGIESQTYSPRQKGAGTNMKNYGTQIGYLKAYNLDYEEISPLTWYKTYKISSGMEYKARKRKTADLMEELYPDYKHLFYGPKGGLQDGKTDALAIAHSLFVRDSS